MVHHAGSADNSRGRSNFLPVAPLAPWMESSGPEFISLDFLERARECNGINRVQRARRVRCGRIVDLHTFRRFWAPNPRQIAPSRETSQKNPEKTGRSGPKTGGNWRFSEGPKRHFAVLAADRRGSQSAKLPDLTSWDFGCRQPPATRQIGKGAPFFEAEAGTDVGATRGI
jgi:hypothetical protein